MDKYRVVCYYSHEDNAYLAYAPEYPGCIADEETPEAASKELDVVVKAWLEIAAEDGIDLTNRKEVSRWKN